MRYLVFLSVLLAITSCSHSLKDYHGNTPEFDLKHYFSHKVTAWGIVQDYSDSLTRRFCVEILPSWQQQQGQLHETFYYADGEQQIRIWQLTITDDGRVTGTADDVVGIAEGRATGNAFRWQYQLEVLIDGEPMVFTIDDWMFQLDQHRVMNRSYMSKFGLPLAEISLFFDSSIDAKDCSDMRATGAAAKMENGA